MHSVVFFDGVCNLCSAAVQTIIKADKNDRFRFASIQSDTAKKLLGGPYLNESMALMENGKIYYRSDAALRIAKHLKFPWRIFSSFIYLPRFIRDNIYNLIAKNRYRMFGKKNECMVPTPELKKKFI